MHLPPLLLRHFDFVHMIFTSFSPPSQNFFEKFLISLLTTCENAIKQKGEIKMLTLKDLNTTQTWTFENKTDASNFISTMSFGFEWKLIDNNTNEVIACHIYE